LHLHEGPGDILVFLTGSEECEKAAKLCFLKLQELKIKKKVVPNMMIFTLYGSQSPDEQVRVFEPAPLQTRKVK
jgi:HrpA-like RNA helicase